jgi:hypothetical protein
MGYTGGHCTVCYLGFFHRQENIFARKPVTYDKADGDGFAGCGYHHQHLYRHPTVSFCAAAQD